MRSSRRTPSPKPPPPLLAQPAKYGPHLTTLLKTIDNHLGNQPDTPYRTAILQVKRRAEAARRGETPPSRSAKTRRPPRVAAVGQPAPDFVATDLAAKAPPACATRWASRSCLSSINPASATTPAVLRYTRERSPPILSATVVGMLCPETSTGPPATRRDRLTVHVSRRRPAHQLRRETAHRR